jgi:hypothetical protein
LVLHIQKLKVEISVHVNDLGIFHSYSNLHCFLCSFVFGCVSCFITLISKAKYIKYYRLNRFVSKLKYSATANYFICCGKELCFDLHTGPLKINHP